MGKKRLLTFFTFIIIGLFLSMTSAVQPTQQFNKIFLTPFYTASSTQNTNISFSVNVNPPDKIQTVLSAILNFDVWMNPSVNFSLLVNNQLCNTPSYYISTTYASAGKTTVSFDCSNVINKAGSYSVILKSNKDTGAITSWLDLTYENNPSGLATIHGTEYVPHQNGKVWLQLIDGSGNTVSNGICYMDMYSPTNSVSYLENAPMTNLNHDGLYVYDFIVPETDGVYPVIAKCYYIAGLDKRNATVYSLISGVLKSGIINDTRSLDLAYLIFTTNKNGGLTVNNRVNATFNFTDVYTSCNNVSEVLLTGISVSWTGKWAGASTHNIYMSYYNYTSSRWITFLNVIEGGSGAVSTVGNSLTLNNITKALGINSTNPMRIKFADNDFNEGAKDFSTDYLYVSCDQLANPVYQQVKGSSEVHVTAPPPYLFEYSTLCSGLTDANYLFGCAEFQNYSGLFEGIVFENITIMNSYNRNFADTLDYITPLGLDCTGVLNITRNINGTITNLMNSSTLTLGDNENCIITLPILLEDTYPNYSIQLVMDNYPKWEVMWAKSVVDGMNTTISNYCLRLANYTVPLLNEPNSTDTEINYCARAIDDLWYFYANYQNSLSINTIGSYLSYLSESRYYYPIIYNHYQHIKLNSPVNLTNIDIDTITSRINASINDIPRTVWSYSEGRNLTYYVVNNISVLDIWNYTNRSLTYYPDTTNYTKSAESVWSWTGSIFSGILNYFTNAIWESPSRNLTFYPDMTNYSRIAEGVWQYQGDRNLTYYVVNNISTEDIWGFMNRSLSFYPNQTDMTNYSLVADYVWLYMDRNLSFYPVMNISISDIWSFTNRSLTQDIPMQIWNYPNRNVSSGDLPFEIWSYYNRSLTYYTLNLTQIIEMINNYDFSQTPIFIPQATTPQFSSNILNVTLYVPV